MSIYFDLSFDFQEFSSSSIIKNQNIIHVITKSKIAIINDHIEYAKYYLEDYCILSLIFWFFSDKNKGQSLKIKFINNQMKINMIIRKIYAKLMNIPFKRAKTWELFENAIIPKIPETIKIIPRIEANEIMSG